MLWSVTPKWYQTVIPKRDSDLDLNLKFWTRPTYLMGVLLLTPGFARLTSQSNFGPGTLPPSLERGLPAPFQPPRRPNQQVDPRNDCVGVQIVKQIIRLHNLTELTLDSLSFSFFLFLPTKAWNKNEPVWYIWVFTLASFSLWVVEFWRFSHLGFGNFEPMRFSRQRKSIQITISGNCFSHFSRNGFDCS